MVKTALAMDDDKDRVLTYWEARAILVELGVIVDEV
jgi:hypothetical protein